MPTIFLQQLMDADRASGSLLNSLYRGNEQTDSVIIRDTVEQGGRPLLKCWVCQCAHDSFVHVFLFDNSCTDWSSGIPSDVSKRLIFHDCYSDPLGWNNDVITEGDSPEPMHDILRDCSATPYLEEIEKAGQEDTVVVFDSLSPLLSHHPGSSVCRLLHGVGRRCSLVLSLVHADLHEDHVISQLNHVTSTNIVMSQFPEGDVVSKSCLCSVQHRKKSGKLLREKSTVSISPSFTSMSSSVFKVHPTTAPHTTHTSTPSQLDPAANLSFDLRLTTKEKQDRANVVLPYTQVGVASGKGVGQIFYQPDEADDFDESDPDDDLDI